MKDIYIDQPKNLGDIIFVMAIAQYYISLGHKVCFPLTEKFLNPSIQKNFPGVDFILIDKFENYSKYRYINKFEDDSFMYFLLRDILPMSAKYLTYNFSVDMWRTIKITRDLQAEKELIKLLGVKSSEKFNLINKNYAKSITSKLLIKPNNDYKNILMNQINGFNLFDWMGVIELAETIHTIHTSVHYILDIMSNITNEIHIYPRKEMNQPHSRYDYLFKKSYIYH
jgi:hypothetical protein